jgi:hypothetical protein
MTAVNISGTFAKDDRPNNGLEHIADELTKDEFTPRSIVGIVVPHRYTKEVGEALTPVVRFIAIEAVDDDDAALIRGLINKYRQARAGSPLDETLFDAEGWAKDDEDD